ncbi:MAG TPA: Na+/H+ antiporter NhaC [Candidatus Blautia ornithocaccae]|nr:Na+/H+ antiporter NhaC [Candidatus Blautia ornithocaccae]
MTRKKEKKMTLAKAVFVFAFVIVSLLTVTIALDGPAHIAMLISAIAAGIVAVCSGYTWDELQEGIGETIKAAVPAILILLAIGVIMGVWLLGGIVPTMIYYGLEILSPSVFLLASCLICAVISTATGSSWSTVGTIGVALMGIGSGLGVPAGMTAGAIISGAYFGDKMSPLSDTTNLAPAMAGTDIFSHIRHMMFTTAPSFLIALILFGILGVQFAGNNFDSSIVNTYLDTLQDTFMISPIMLIPPILVIAMVALKVPALPGLLAVAFLGCLFAVIFQGASLQEVISSAFSGFSIETGVSQVDNLLNRGGMTSMMEIICLILISLSFAGIVEKSGMVKIVIEKALKNAKKDSTVVTVTLLSTIFTNFATGVQYVALIIPGRMFRDIYKERGLHPKNLSRALEDTGTLCAPFVPWGTDAAFLSGVLGVTTGIYAPFCFLNYINPIISLICAQTGWTIVKTDQNENRQ